MMQYTPLWPLVEPHIAKVQRNGRLPRASADGWFNGLRSPLRADKNPGSFSVRPDSATEPGAFNDFATDDHGSIADLATRLGIDPYISNSSVSTKKIDPKAERDGYPAAHGCTWQDFARWDAKPVTFQEHGKKYHAIAFPDATGTRYRLFGHEAKFKPQKSGLAPCWYGLREATELATQTNQPLVIVNGQPSVIAAHAHQVAACTIPGGEGSIAGHLERGLLADLQSAWQGKIIVLLDGDTAGYKAAARLTEVLLGAGYDVVAKDAGLGMDAANVCQLNNGSSVAAIQTLPDLRLSPVTNEDISAEAPVEPRFTIGTEADLMALSEVRYLDRDLGLIASAFHLVYGASGSGKTFFVIERAMRQANHGRRVLYIPTEDVSGLRYRIAAWHKAHPEASGHLTWLRMPEGLDLQDHKQVADLIETIQPYRYDHIVIDTLREAHTGDENSSQDTARINRAIQRLVATGAAIDVVHHTGVAGERPRGSTALFGNCDVVIKIDNDDGLVRVSFDKLRNAAPREALAFGLVQQDTGLLDSDGEHVLSAILRPTTQFTRRDAPMSPTARKVLEALAMSIFATTGAKTRQLAEAAQVAENKSLYRALSWLKDRKFITQSIKGDPYYITLAGLAQLGPEYLPLSTVSDSVSDPVTATSRDDSDCPVTPPTPDSSALDSDAPVISDSASVSPTVTPLSSTVRQGADTPIPLSVTVTTPRGDSDDSRVTGGKRQMTEADRKQRMLEELRAYEQDNADFWQSIYDNRTIVDADHSRGIPPIVQVKPWSDGPDQVEVSAGRVQELMDGGLSKRDAQRQATAEARAAAPPDPAYRTILRRPRDITRESLLDAIDARRAETEELAAIAADDGGD
jgi:hypothetical protein